MPHEPTTNTTTLIVVFKVYVIEATFSITTHPQGLHFPALAQEDSHMTCDSP